MFIEQYKLESNPFVADSARPVFASHSMRYAALKLDELVSKQVQSLFLSGPAGVGKTTFVRHRFRHLCAMSSVSWVKPHQRDRGADPAANCSRTSVRAR